MEFGQVLWTQALPFRFRTHLGLQGLSGSFTCLLNSVTLFQLRPNSVIHLDHDRTACTFLVGGPGVGGRVQGEPHLCLVLSTLNLPIPETQGWKLHWGKSWASRFHPGFFILMGFLFRGKMFSSDWFWWEGKATSPCKRLWSFSCSSLNMNISFHCTSAHCISCL